MEHVFEEKDLGVIVDSDMDFEEHISKKVALSNAIVGLIRRTFSYLDPQMFVKLFTALVRPHLEYGQAVWSPHMKKQIDAIEKVQIRATKLVDGFKDMTYEEGLRKLNLPTLAYRRLRGDIIEIFKHFNRYDQEILPPSFHPRARPSRQHKFQLHEVSSADGERGAQSNFLYQRISWTWNELPSSVVETEDINTFKNRLDEHWKDHPSKFDLTPMTSDS